MTHAQAIIPPACESMVERVARAICAASGFGEAFEHLVGQAWTHWLPEARAAIAAMREPTEAMILAAMEGNEERVRVSPQTAKARSQTYTTMIDAALADYERGER